MESLHDEKIKLLEETANLARQDVIKMLAAAGSGHPAGSLGIVEILTAFYFHILKHNPSRPSWPDRDRLVLSHGHICPALYAILARAGYFPLKELQTLRQIGSNLQGHPHRKSLPGLETTSGPLGSGLSQAIGMALTAKLDNKKYRIYCLMSDGEQQEGNTWEAVMFAAKNKLNNLTAILDRNSIQITGFTENVMPLESLKRKYEAFNWHVVEIDGHDFYQIVSAAAEAEVTYEKPTLILAHTIPGKGVGFMERDYRWHGAAPKKDEAEKALKELKNQHEYLKKEHLSLKSRR